MASHRITIVAWLCVLILAAILVPASSDSPTDAISREFAVYTRPLDTPVSDALSREFAVYADGTDVDVAEALSREFAVYANTADGAMVTDSFSREFAVYVSPSLVTDALSREFAVYADTPVARTDAISRVFSAFVAGNRAPLSLRGAKGAAETQHLSVAGMNKPIVTAVLPEGLYIENPDRSAGILVKKPDPTQSVFPSDWPVSVTPGSAVDIVGFAGVTDNQERYILATQLAIAGSGSIDPLGLNGKVLGGGNSGWSTLNPVGQRQLNAYDYSSGTVKTVIGLDNVGLLVRLPGKVTWVSQDGSQFIIDDGSGTSWGDPVSRGVRVSLPAGVTAPSLDSLVAVTGISSCYKSGDAIYRLLRMRDAGDIVLVQP